MRYFAPGASMVPSAVAALADLYQLSVFQMVEAPIAFACPNGASGGSFGPATESSSAAFRNGVFYDAGSMMACEGTQFGSGAASVGDASPGVDFVFENENFPAFQSAILTSSAGQTLALSEGFGFSVLRSFYQLFSS